MRPLKIWNLLAPEHRIFRVVQRSKRVFTVWISRDEPDYYKQMIGFNSRFLQAWEEERDTWHTRVVSLGGFEYVACYPATHWIHLTVKIQDG